MARVDKLLDVIEVRAEGALLANRIRDALPYGDVRRAVLDEAGPGLNPDVPRLLEALRFVVATVRENAQMSKTAFMERLAVILAGEDDRKQTGGD